jgi:hypothetical protein
MHIKIFKKGKPCTAVQSSPQTKLTGAQTVKTKKKMNTFFQSFHHHITILVVYPNMLAINGIVYNKSQKNTYNKEPIHSSCHEIV